MYVGYAVADGSGVKLSVAVKVADPNGVAVSVLPGGTVGLSEGVPVPLTVLVGDAVGGTV